MSQTVRHLYEFGPFRLDATERLLLRGEQHIPITPKAFETLLVLVENGGHVIDKDELIKKVWPNTFVEEVNLAKNVSHLRKILAGEQAGQFIETIPKRGYRFVAGVKEVWEENIVPPAPEAGSPPPAAGGSADVAQAEVTGGPDFGPKAGRDVNGRGTNATRPPPFAGRWRWPLALFALGL